MRTVFHAALILLIPLILRAQTPSWQWAAGGNGNNTSQGNDITADASGNSYVTGYFTGSISFDTTVLSSAGGRDIYVAKFSPNGSVAWAKRFGGTGDDEGSGICIDNAGYIFITGYFSDTVAFGPVNIVSSGETDIFLAKIDWTGNVDWVKRAGGQYPAEGSSVYCDDLGNPHVTGSFGAYNGSPPMYDTASFDNISIISHGGSDIFVAKYNINGDIIWAKEAGGVFSDHGYAIKVDKFHNVFVTGAFNNPWAYFDTLKLNSNSSGFVTGNMFIAKYDSSGHVIWARAAGGIASGSISGGSVGGGASIATDTAGNVLVTGTFHDCKMNFGSMVLNNIGDADIYLAKYSPDGNVLWARAAGYGSFDVGRGVCTDAAANVYITGNFNQWAQFGSIMLSATGGIDLFVARYDKDGNAQWAVSAGGPGYDLGNSLVHDHNGNIYVTGYFNGAAQFGQHYVFSSGSSNMFVAELHSPASSIGETGQAANVTLSPNPSPGILVLDQQGLYYTSIKIFDQLGRVVYQADIHQPGQQMNLAHLPDGIYYVLLSGTSFYSQKIRIQHE